MGTKTETPDAALRREYAGKLFKLSALHTPFRIYAECDHRDDEHAERGIDEVRTEDFTTCEDGYLYSICRSCCTREHEYQTEDCAESHGHTPQTPICLSRRILDEGSA